MKRVCLLLVLGMAVWTAGLSPVRAAGFIVIDRPTPMPPILPPPPPRPPVREIPLAVRNHQVTCDISDGVAVTRIDQTFYNRNPWPVEGTYIFPLDDDIALSRFTMFVGGREVVGEVLEREEARRIYESIVSRRRDPALLEYVGTRMYKARIFPIAANGEVRVRLEYAQVLATEGGLVRYRYPLSTEKFSSEPLEQVSVVVKIESKLPIKSVFCPTHTMAIRRDSEHRASASFEAKNVKPDRDLILYYTLSEKDFGLALLSYREARQEGFFLARIAPQAVVDAADVMPKDICFVVDTSGSMAGAKIGQAKKALTYCLASLNTEDRFHLVTFSHETAVFSGGLQTASADNRARAERFVEQIRAEGGTNINEALLAALQGRASGPGGDRPYLIVFLTDGQPTIGETDPQKILANVKQGNVHGVRLFVFGIGNDVNTHLLDRLAAENHGARDYVGPREDLEIKLSNFYRKVASPVLANLGISFKGVAVHDVFPREIGDLFAGGEVVLVGRYSGSGPASVEVLGDRRGTRERYVYEPRFAELDTMHGFLPRLWATRKVGYLLDQIRLHGENKELIDAVAQLAIKYGIITPYTAYLVHEQQQTLTRTGGINNALDRMLQRAAARPKSEGRRGRVALGGGFRAMRGAPSGAVAVADSKEANVMNFAFATDLLDTEYAVQDDLAIRDEAGRLVNAVQQVNNRASYNDGDVWTDSAYLDGTPTQRIELYSEEYFALARSDRRAARYLAQGPRVIFVLDGVAYETVAER